MLIKQGESSIFGVAEILKFPAKFFTDCKHKLPKRCSLDEVSRGRSMIEMLGVLAIVGVLSVGGIAGYQKAMNKYYINELVAGVTQLAVNIRTEYAHQNEYKDFSAYIYQGYVYSYNNFYDIVGSDKLKYLVKRVGFYEISVLPASDGRAFMISFGHINKDLCQTLASYDWGSSSDNLFGIVTGNGIISYSDGVKDYGYGNCVYQDSVTSCSNGGLWTPGKDLPRSPSTDCGCSGDGGCHLTLFYK